MGGGGGPARKSYQFFYREYSFALSEDDCKTKYGEGFQILTP